MKERLDNSIRVRGFTLVEMLVVISILLLLIAVALPAFTGVVLTVHVGQSQSIVNQLDTAVKLYQADFSSSPNRPGGTTDGLPPSNYFDGTSTWYGSQSLAYYLTGYHMDASNNVAYGLHPNRNSPVYGPYHDTDKLQMLPGCPSVGSTSTKTLQNVTYQNVYYASKTISFYDDQYGYIADTGGHVAHPVFLDAFGAVIIYYSTNRIGDTTHTFNMNDNYCNDGIHNVDVNGSPIPIGSPGTYCIREDQNWTGTSHTSHTDPSMISTSSGISTNWTAMFCPPPTSYYQSTTGVNYRGDYMLMSWGGDTQWYNGTTQQLRDDATNLYGK